MKVADVPNLPINIRYFLEFPWILHDFARKSLKLLSLDFFSSMTWAFDSSQLSEQKSNGLVKEPAGNKKKLAFDG